jgi:hypothetical protein
MNFKDIINKKLVQEVSANTVEKIPTGLKDLLTDKSLPFEDVFGDAVRIAEMVKITSPYEAKINNHLMDNFTVDFEKWVGYKLNDVDKKNPYRIGKILNKRKNELTKFIADAKAKPIDHANESIQLWERALEEVDELLKLTNLKELYTDGQKGDKVVIFSRAPIDVVRMSDFTWSSCHSEGGDYFHCALADASLNAGIAYLVTKEDYDSIVDRLQDEEIFSDSDRGIKGITPLARIRIRAVIDSQGNTLAVPSLRVYKSSNNINVEDFKNSVIAWAKKQDLSKINTEEVLKLKGGSYEDYGHDIKTCAKIVFGIELKYKTQTDDESDFRSDLDDENDWRQEQWLDEIRDDFDAEKIYKEAFGDNYEHNFDVGYDPNDGEITLSYRLGNNFPKYIKKIMPDIPQKTDLAFLIPAAHSWQEATKLAATLSFKEDELIFHIEKRFILSDYAEYEGGDAYGGYNGNFREKSLINDVAAQLLIVAESFLGKELEMIYDSYNYNISNEFNAKICEHLNIPYEKVDSNTIEEFYNGYTFQGTGGYDILEPTIRTSIPHFKYKFRQDGYVRGIDIDEAQAKVLVQTISDIEDKIFTHTFKEMQMPEDEYYNMLHVRIALPDAPDGFYRTEKFGDKELFFYVNKTCNKPTIEWYAFIDDDELQEIIDKNQTTKMFNVFDYIYGEFSEKYLDTPMSVFDLQDTMKKVVPPNEYKELENQGQMKLDLSSINNYMTKFDEFIKNLFEEGLGQGAPMGKGLTRQGGAGTTPNSSSAAVPGGVKPANGVQMQHSNTGVKPMNPSAISGSNTVNPQEMEEFNNVLQLQKSNPQDFNKSMSQMAATDPDKFSRFFSHYTNTLNPQSV